MADKMQFDFVSPERRLVSAEVDRVAIPGMEGDLTALPNHAPLLTTLRPGVVRAYEGGSVMEYVVTGGFAEISPAGAQVLAEEAVPREEVTREWLDAAIKDAEEALAVSGEKARALAALRVNDLKALGGQLGL
ncbi:ATP synthase F1 subunit epsilon [Oceanicella actignis]|uniref:ATP synthase epsilon chain n=1 Tax=Oceanicella actignis TaxID=1189325 RepID=A0A1M7T3F0_9RHOB|nr:ATP synthase F1 subunit epsilon [Oceanicella actignis]TYO88838.1 F-type H+-transporting ATPase subunit epsilon [Oceanicella actignis]SET39950.1 ATP synthase F1 subcomplex epsilon subunit [Oceanicella actignis]SHN65229.1 F-type H+-transporting ATPase subunit epsilon [Oceanicella actignis]